MMNGLISFWARNSVAANLLMIIAFVGGIVGFMRVEQESFPAANWNGVSVAVSWPGASPSDIEEQITTRIEEAIADIDGLKRLVSTSRQGSTDIELEVRANVDIDTFLNQVKSRVDAVNNLPPSSYRPQVERIRLSDQYLGLVLYGDVDLRSLKRLAEQIRDQVARLPGAELADTFGVLSEEVTIELSEDAMQRYDLSFDTVASAIRNASINQSGGQVKSDTGAVSLQVRSLADTREQFENLIVRQLRGGGVIRVADVARVQDGFIDEELDVRYQGVPASFIMMAPTETMYLPRYSKAIRNFVKESSETLPESVKLRVLWDDNDFMSELIRIITSAAFFGTLLVVLLLVMFLRPTVALWVAVGIATAFAGGFALLPYMGVSLNILTLFACLLVIGVIVDDAIIIGENIHRQVERGLVGGVEPAIEGTSRVAKPVVFGVITTMIAFAPWALLSGPERQFTQNFTLTVIAALTFSLIEAFLILPNHLSKLKPVDPAKRGRFSRFQSRVANSMIVFADKIYRPILVRAIRYRYATMAFFVSLFILALGLLMHGYVKTRIMPEIEGNLLIVSIDLPDGTPFSRVLDVRDRIEDGIDQLTAETTPDGYVFGPDQVDHAGAVVRGGSVIAQEGRYDVMSYIGLTPPEVRPGNVSSKKLAARLREIVGPIPDADEVRFDFDFNRRDNTIRFALSHSQLGVLQQASAEVRQKFAGYAGTYDIGDTMASPNPEMRFALKPGAQALGVDLSQVARQVAQAYYGEEVQRLPRDGEDVRVMVKLPKSARSSLDSIRDFRIRTTDGRQIPITELVEISFAPGIDRIRRRDRQRYVGVFAHMKGDGGQQVRQDMKDNFFPDLLERYPGLEMEEIGAGQSQQEFFEEVTILQLVSFAVMYVLLAISFGSYAQPLLIMTAIPFGFAGAVFGHLLFGVPMAMFSIFGIAAAAGVVINDNLVLVDYVNRRRSEGLGAVQSLVEAGVTRFRPVVLTSLTTFIGIAPMIFEQSVQSQFLRPMVVSLACAVLFALFVTLLLVPSLYATGAEVKRFVVWMVTGRPFIPIGTRYDDTRLPDVETSQARLAQQTS